MPTIEQVSKRLFSDRNWLKKGAIGVLLIIVPIANILSFGYLYRIFISGKRGEEISLPEWDDLKGLFMDGLRFLVIGLIFAVLPIALIAICSLMLHGLGPLANLPMIPVCFIAGPVFSAALYLYAVKGELKDCFNVDALSAMLKGSLTSYTLPTLGYLGLCLICTSALGLIVLPIPLFVGGLVYFYVMGQVYRDLQLKMSA